MVAPDILCDSPPKIPNSLSLLTRCLLSLWLREHPKRPRQSCGDGESSQRIRSVQAVSNIPELTRHSFVVDRKYSYTQTLRDLFVLKRKEHPLALTRQKDFITKRVTMIPVLALSAAKNYL